MFECRELEFQCLKGNGRNSNVNKNRARITMFERTRSEFQCFKNYGHNTNIWKDKTMFYLESYLKDKIRIKMVGIKMVGSMRSEF